MIQIRPFKAYLPNKEYVNEIICPPYDVIDINEAKEIVKKKGQKNFIRVIRSEVDFTEDINPYNPAVYTKAKENLSFFIRNQYFLQDDFPNFYLYELIWQNRSQIGIVGLNHIDDYIQNKIKKHELTRPDKEEDRFRHIDITGFHCEPVFLMFSSQKYFFLQEFLENLIKNLDLEYDVVDDQNIRHKIYKLKDQQLIKTIQDSFRSIDSLYIADGHHRTAATVKIGLQRKKEDQNYHIERPYYWFLSVIFPSEHLRILPYNRVIKDLNFLTKEEFLARIHEKFILTEGKENPIQLHKIKMYIDREWYTLTLKKNFYRDHIIQNLDVSYLQDYILDPILGIKDPRTSDRIFFVGGIKGDEELEKLVQEGKGQIAFSLYPTPVDTVIEVANQNQVMPPKSTWFEPKLKSGFFLNQFEF